MAIQIIPVQQSEPNYRIGVTLLGVAYWFDFRWNAGDPLRPAGAPGWFLDVYDANEKPIWNGIRIVIGTYLGRACNASPFTDGVLMAFDTSGKGLDAGFDDFGTRVKLVYMPAVDLLAVQQKFGVT